MDKTRSKTLIAGLVSGALLLSPALLAGDKHKTAAKADAQQMMEKQQWDANDHKDMLPKININSATAKEIAKALPGIGLKKAQAIVDYRLQHGDFANVEELLKIKGIGKKSLEAARPMISVAAPK